MTPISRWKDQADWERLNPILSSGVPGFERETGKVKIGTGSARWNDLPYQNVAPYTFPQSVSTSEMSDIEARSSFISVVDAGSNLSKPRPTGAVSVLWKFNSGVNVGTNGVNVVNRQSGDLIFVAS